MFGNKSKSQMPVTVYEEKDGYRIESDLPGVAKSGVKISVSDGKLLVKATRIKPSGKTTHDERSLQEVVERSISLEEDMDPRSIKASLVNGVLTLHVGKLSKDSFSISIT